MTKLSPELEASIIDIVNACIKEDDQLRIKQLRYYKKLEEFWHGIQYLFWSDKDEAWRSPQELGNYEDIREMDELGSFSDKVVDIFRGHGESIIAALSAQIPALRFLPDDADDDSDVLCARTKSKVADLIQRHNKAKLIFLRALFFSAINGNVYSYRYKDSDFSYGSYTVPVYGVETVNKVKYVCLTCGYESDVSWSASYQNSGQSFDPENCPQCGYPEIPKEVSYQEEIPIKLEDKKLPKTRVKIDIFGGLHVKVHYYARSQKETPYLILFGDLSKYVVAAEYPDFVDEIYAAGLSEDHYYRFTKPDQEANNNMLTVIRAWLRPNAFFKERDKFVRDKLLKKFPNGCRVTLIGSSKVLIDYEAESLDDRWEIGQAGLSTYIHSDPFMRPLVEIQEMRNDLMNLIIETIRHGIESTFADPAVVDFDNYKRYEAVPGYIYKTKAARPGEAIGNSFYSTNRSTLSQEVGLFLKQLDMDAQFSLGSFPSIYGGPAEGKTRTFSEYAASRQMALQRLSIMWNLITDWWVRTISGCVEMYVDIIKETGEDERFVKYENNNYVNVWIRQTDLSGKTGGVEPEASETFPVSLAQKKDLLMKLIELNNEYINQALYLPENARILQDVMALNEFKLPGELQRIKQTLEINELLKTGPIDEIMSSVQPDPDVDDHEVHMVVLKNWMVDSVGLDCQKTNPEGFANIKAHFKQHEMMLMQKMMPANLVENPEEVPEGI